MPSDMAARMREPGRLLVGHPFNPPHVVPLVEVVPGAQTPAETAQAAADFYRSLGKVPVVLHKEIGGFVANRLQSALFRESVNLVLQGVVTPEELDQVVTESVGVRWATAGPFESYHLGGGPGGIRHLLEHLGPGMVRRWKDLGQPELTDELVDRISTDTETRFADAPYDAPHRASATGCSSPCWRRGSGPGARPDPPARLPHQVCATSTTTREPRPGPGSDHHPERQPGPHAQADRRLALEAAGPGHLAEGARAAGAGQLTRVGRAVGVVARLRVVRRRTHDDLQVGGAAQRHPGRPSRRRCTVGT